MALRPNLKSAIVLALAMLGIGVGGALPAEPGVAGKWYTSTAIEVAQVKERRKAERSAVWIPFESGVTTAPAGGGYPLFQGGQPVQTGPVVQSGQSGSNGTRGQHTSSSTKGGRGLSTGRRGTYPTPPEGTSRGFGRYGNNFAPSAPLAPGVAAQQTAQPDPNSAPFSAAVSMDLKVSKNKLTGSIVETSLADLSDEKLKVEEGTLDGSKVKFTTYLKVKGTRIGIIWQGELGTDDRLTLTRKSSSGMAVDSSGPLVFVRTK